MTIKEVHSLVDKQEPISLNAVMTVMSRLHEKGMLFRHSTGQGRTRLTLFEASQSKNEFISEQTQAITDGLFADFGSFMVQNLITNLDQADPELIKQLERKLQDLRRDDE
ncbi:BlaI/MecI/CopY family transcriptional regulator [Paenibacillus illinoisensis]|uniref:BlaI/MecI/CopY family transcriptional regulator n=1 Tax=Paenibacillus illinoisensis TaxID=59845 RepID=UPI00301C4D89